MKKIILILNITLLSVMSFGQNVTYISEPTQKMLNPNNFTNRFNTVQDNGQPMILNLKFHGVHETDGNDLHNINEERFLKVVASLNLNFNQFNIFFKYRGYGIIKNSQLVTSGNTYALVDAAMQDGNYDENSINIIVYNGWVWGTGGLNNLLLTTLHPDVSNLINGSSPFYESETNCAMGGYLSLLPTYTGAGWNSNFVINNIPACISNPIMNKASFISSSTNYQPENVTRNINDQINYNADTAGDMVADTQACFRGFYNNYCDFPPFQNFVQHPEVIDNIGVPYTCSATESKNYMSLTNNSGLTNSFTPGQGARMRQYIISNSTDFDPLLNLLENGISDISVLYEPFAMGGGSGGISNTTTSYSKTYSANTTNTGANVWNCGPFTMRFQTGFDCEFYTQTGTVNQNPYQHYDGTTSTQIGLKIPILGQQIYTNYAPVCFYSFEPFTSGDIKSLNNLGSGVYTQEQLDEIKASDPKLYEELQSGKYHIITKQTDSGFIDQKIIYKN